MEYLQTLSRDGSTVKRMVLRVLLARTKPDRSRSELPRNQRSLAESSTARTKSAAEPSANVQQITLRRSDPSIGAIDGRKQGEIETMSSIKPVRGNLRLLQEMNLGPDRKMAAGIVPERIIF